MPYAAHNTISQAPLDGGITITDEQYAEALAGMCGGLEVMIEGGQLVIASPPVSEADPA